MYRIHEIDQFRKEHFDEWQKLWQSTADAHFFNSPAWFSAYLKAFPEAKPHIFFCYKSDELGAVLPLVETKKFGIKVLAGIANRYEFLDRSTLLLAKKDAALAGYLLKKVGAMHNLYLAELEESDAKVFKSSGQKQLSVFSTLCPRMNIGKDVLATLSRKQKKSLLKKIRKNESDLVFKMHRDGLERHLETMIELERKSHKKSKGISIFNKPEIRLLYRSLAKNAGKHVGIAFLYFQGRPIAHRFGFFYHGTFLSVHVAFDDRFRALGPGKLLLYYCLEYFRGNKVGLLDFSVGDNYLKQQFADNKISQFHIFHSRSFLVRSWWSILLMLKNQAKHVRKTFQK